MENVTDNIIEDLWSEIVILLQNLIQAFPNYLNPNGNFIATELIKKHLDINQIEFEEIRYRNNEFSNHSLFVKTDEFSNLFKDDNVNEKRNIVAIIDSKRPGKTIILNGHYDVDGINNPNSWSDFNGWSSGKIKDNYIYGRGATDMLGGLCGLILILTALSKLKWTGKVIFTAVCDEEIGGNGTLKMLLWLKKNGHLDKKTMALIAEPTNRSICLESLGFFHFKVEAKRSNMHMGVAENSNNSIYDIIQIIKDFGNLIYEVLDNLGVLSELNKIKHNWGTIAGGQDASIPFELISSEGVFFLPETINFIEFKNLLRKIINERYNGVISIEFGSFYFEGAISPSNLLHDKLLIKELFPHGYSVSQGIFYSPCDARLFKAFSIPVIIYGPGSLKQAHSADEFIFLPEIKQYTKHALKGILSVLK